MFHKKNKAFDCANCPRNNDPLKGSFCPAWWEEPWYVDGVEEIRKSCAFTMLPTMLRKLGEASQLSVSTTHEMNKRIDLTNNTCNKVSAQLQGMAQALYIAADMKEKMLTQDNENEDSI